MSFLSDIAKNNVLIASVIAWFVAQFIKVLLTFVKTSNIDFNRFIGSGGMPSAHSAFTVCLAVSIGKMYTFQSSIFALAASFSLVVMYDAAGVRRAVGRQANLLNKLLKEYADTKKVKEEQLLELVGHTPFEVLAGAILGVIIANIYI